MKRLPDKYSRNISYTIGKVGGEPTLATKIFAVMGLNIKKGDTVSVTVDGGNEEINVGTMERLFKNYAFTILRSQ